MQKKLFSILLAFGMLFSILPMVLPTAAVDETVTEIGTADALTALMGDNTKWAGSYKLIADIDLTGLTQSSIGNSTTPFGGTFDANGHVVKGLNVASGLFGVISGATIKNLTVEGTVNAAANNAAGIVGFISNNGTVQNCINKAVVISSASRAAGIVGGVTCTGESGNVIIENCKNLGDISGENNIGGIVGRFEIGANGKNGTYNVRNCANYGTITASQQSGGLMGFYSNNAAGITTYIENNLNAGDVIAQGGVVGGICGNFRVYSKSNMTVALRHCMNTGDITSSASDATIGGIVGVGDAQAGAYTFECNYNSGSVSNANNANDGAIASGLSSKATVQNNYALDIGETHGVTSYVTMVTTDNYADEATFTGFSADYWMFTDKGPELITHHVHDLDAKYIIVEDGHASSCYCNDVSTVGKTQEHTFVDGTCNACGKTDCLHQSTKDIVTLASTCIATGYKNVVCADCETVLEENVVLAIDAASHVGFSYISSGNEIICVSCKAAATPDTDAVITVTPVTIAEKIVTVTVSVKATAPIMVASFKVNAPEGFTLTAAEPLINTADESSVGFSLITQDLLSLPYEAAVLNMSMQEATVDAAVLKLTFAVDDTVEKGTYVVMVESLETYNYAAEVIETASISAEVTVTETEAVAGDVNMDGSVTIQDVLIVIRAVLNNQTIENGDLNGDGKVSLIDVIRTMKLISQ